MNRRGMTLIELLVGLAITCIIAYIAFDLIQSEQNNYTKTRTKVRLQSDAREAIRIMEEDFSNIGFRQGLITGTGKSPIFASLSVCPTIRSDSRIKVWDDSGRSSDTIEAWFNRPHATNGVDCKATPFRVRYFVANRQLIRSISPAGDTSGTFRDAVVLDSVVTMQVRIGTDNLLTSTIPADTLMNHPLSNAVPAPASGSSLAMGARSPYRAKDTMYTVSGWSTTEQMLDFNATGSVFHNSSYQFSCMLQVNGPFHAAFPGGSIRFFAQLDSMAPETLAVSLPKLINGPTWISWLIQIPKLQGISAIPRIGMAARLGKDTSTANIQIGSIHLRRISGEPVRPVNSNDHILWNWEDGLPDSATSTRIEGLRIWLVAKSKKRNQENNTTRFDSVIGNWDSSGTLPSGRNTYAVYERTIPVVKYGY